MWQTLFELIQILASEASIYIESLGLSVSPVGFGLRNLGTKIFSFFALKNTYKILRGISCSSPLLFVNCGILFFGVFFFFAS